MTNIPQAARELAKAIEVADTGLNDEWPKDYFWKVEGLLTVALKRCRNEALEEAAKWIERHYDRPLIVDNKPIVYNGITIVNALPKTEMIAGISNLKEAE